MAIGALTEEIAENLEEAAEVTRRLDTKSIGFLLGGVGIGVAIGFYFGYRYNREKIRAEAFKESEEEVEKIRNLYQQKAIVIGEKPSVEEVIEARGYSVAVPPRPLPPPVVVVEPPPVVIYEGGKDKNEGWDYAVELESRNPEHPYVIHQDEFKNAEMEGYAQVAYTYYAEDDVLCDEDDKPLPHADIIVGVENLKFGHGTDDIDVVFVRNDKIELEMEICRSAKSYEEEVMGLEHSDHYSKMYRKNRQTEDDSEND